MRPSAFHFLYRDFARFISQAFEQGEFLLLGGAAEELQRQLAQAGRKAVACSSYSDLRTKLQRDTKIALRFEVALWFYPADESEDDDVANELVRCANEIVLFPGIGASVPVRRPKLVEVFQRCGFIPDYECDLAGIDAGALRLVRQQPGNKTLLAGVESAFARLHVQMRNLERMLRIRMAELEAADRHIARLEEKLLKLKQYRGEIKSLKEQKQALRKSPERRIGQVLLAPYRLPQKLIRTLRGPRPGKAAEKPAAVIEYQQWFERHRVKPEQFAAMRTESRTFLHRPLISIITPVFNTPLEWLDEAVESVIAQAYENWELLLVDDHSTDPAVRDRLSILACRDGRIRVFKLDVRQGISAASNHALAHAAGTWIGLLDHDDLLEPDALFEIVKLLQTNPDADLIYSDEDKLTERGFESPLFKPDWSPDFFLSYNYVGHLTVVRRDIVQKIGGFRSEFDSAQDYDLFLRIVEQSNRIHHIPRVLYHWRRSQDSSATSVRQKPGQFDASRRAVEGYLKHRGEQALVAVEWRTHTFWVRRELAEPRKISIIIPTRDRTELLSRCIDSVVRLTAYPNYEIVVIDNDSQSPEARDYLSELPHRVLRYAGPFNYSAINNFAVEQTQSPWLLFLNNDMEVIDADWLTIMAEQIQRPEIGAVGARLLYPDNTIQHAGVVLGVDGIGTHAFRGFPADDPGVARQLQTTRNYSAVTGACLLTRRDVFDEVGGFDEERLPVAFNDVDLCLKIRRAGYWIVYTPFAKLYHHESASRRRTTVEGPEAIVIKERWPKALERDPYYNPNLSRERADFSLGK